MNDNLFNISENLRKQQEIDTAKAWSHLSRKIAKSSFRIKTWDISRNVAVILLPLLLLHQFLIIPLFDSSQPEMITLTSAPGMITKTVLPDGSEVWLNAQSELIYPQKFTGKERTVKLTGEAFFSVVSNEKNRFNVLMSDDIKVSAFGTEFNIHA